MDRARRPCPDATGELKFELLTTDDGHSWKRAGPPRSRLPSKGKAHSRPATVVLRLKATTSGLPAEAVPPVSSTPSSRGQSWQATETRSFTGPAPLEYSPSLSPTEPMASLPAATTNNPTGWSQSRLQRRWGKTWKLSSLRPQAYFRGHFRPHAQTTHFYCGHRLHPRFAPAPEPSQNQLAKDPRFKLNAVSPYPEGGALFVGPQGTIVALPTGPR